MSNKKSSTVSLWNLFKNFFLIGSYSFGGYMALISIVRKDLVERKKVLTDEQILDGVSLASILPGPVAVNAVVYYGYVLSGIKGSIVSFIAILLPTFLLVLGFSIYYFSPSANSNLDFHIGFVIPVVIAVIVNVGVGMAKKQFKVYSQWFIALLAFIIAVSSNSVFFLIGVILLGGLTGYYLYNESNTNYEGSRPKTSFFKKSEVKILLLTVTCVLMGVLLLSFLSNQLEISLYLFSVFSGMSLTLLGGGYVIVPIMEQAMVNDLGWLTIDQFNAAISISQITPGPIMTSVTFIGYKMAGITGAIVATLAIFMPSSILMLLLSKFQQKIKHLSFIDAVMKGMRAVVVGLIFSGAYAVGASHFSYELIPWVIFLASLLLFMFTKTHPALLILTALFLSFI